MAAKLISKIAETLNSAKTYRIVFIGDSTTSGEWVHPNWREIVEYVLKDKLEKQVSDWQRVYWDLRFINCGMNGAGTQDFLDYIQNEVLDYKPNLVVCVGGDNDMEMDVPPAAHAENISQIRQLLSQTVDDFVFATQISSADKDWNNRYAHYLQNLGISPYGNEIYVNLFAEFAKLDIKKFFTFKLAAEEAEDWGKKVGSIDPIHPNTLGQAHIAKILLKEVFGVRFDPEIYLTELHRGIKYPTY